MFFWIKLVWIFSTTCSSAIPPFPFYNTDYENKFGVLNKEDLNIAREQAKEIFYFGYNNYMKYAFPLDELDPIHCQGRGHDYKNKYFN